MNTDTTTGPTTFGIPIDQVGASSETFTLPVGDTASTLQGSGSSLNRNSLSKKEKERRKAKRKQAKISRRRNR